MRVMDIAAAGHRVPPTIDEYRALVADQSRHDPRRLMSDLAALRTTRVALPDGESAYWALPRVAHEWRLPGQRPGTSDRMVLLPMRDWESLNGYLAIVPQPIVLHRQVADLLETEAIRLMEHYPIEDSLARREHGVPMMIGRFDVVVDAQGDVQICELDDVCSLWPSLPHINPIATTYIHALEDQLGLPIYTAELFQYRDGEYAASPRVRREFASVLCRDDNGDIFVGYIPRAAAFEFAISDANGMHWRPSRRPDDRSVMQYERSLVRPYLHNEDNWRGDITNAWLLDRLERGLDDVALSVRAHRDMPGFQAHLDRFGPRSITMAWERDSKWPLVPANLGALASDLDVALDAARLWQTENPDDLIVLKTLYGARTEGTAIVCSRGSKPKGTSSASQVRRKFEGRENSPIVLQRFKEPDTLATAGITFAGSENDTLDPTADGDRKVIRSVEHIGNSNPGKCVVAGLEGHFSMIFRTFVVYLPGERRLVHAGGMWQATDGRMVHGGSHSVAGPLYVDGLMGHPGASRSDDLDHAEEMIRFARQGRPQP